MLQRTSRSSRMLPCPASAASSPAWRPQRLRSTQRQPCQPSACRRWMTVSVLGIAEHWCMHWYGLLCSLHGTWDIRSTVYRQHGFLCLTFLNHLLCRPRTV